MSRSKRYIILQYIRCNQYGEIMKHYINYLYQKDTSNTDTTTTVTNNTYLYWIDKMIIIISKSPHLDNFDNWSLRERQYFQINIGPLTNIIFLLSSSIFLAHSFNFLHQTLNHKGLAKNFSWWKFVFVIS